MWKTRPAELQVSDRDIGPRGRPHDNDRLYSSVNVYKTRLYERPYSHRVLPNKCYNKQSQETKITSVINFGPTSLCVGVYEECVGVDVECVGVYVECVRVYVGFVIKHCLSRLRSGVGWVGVSVLVCGGGG